MEKQLRRYKRRLKDHLATVRNRFVEHFAAASYILASTDKDEDDADDTLQPIIIAETETKIPSLSVGEAVMQMELAGAPVLVFRNDASDGLKYRLSPAKTGNIGWIDPR